MKLLHFGIGTNKKLGRHIDTFSLPASFSCPFAKDCRSCANRYTGKIKDGKHTKIRCFEASMEMIYPNLRKVLWKNFDLLKACKTKWEMYNLIKNSLPKNSIRIRPSTGGDYFSQMYFDAWLEIARKHPKIKFYSYTKSLPYWVKRIKSIPKNFILTASRGGTHDYLIEEYNLKNVEIVLSENEAKVKKLKIDHDDSLAYSVNPKRFSLLIHGGQIAGSEASKALQALKKIGMSGYGKTIKNRQK